MHVRSGMQSRLLTLALVVMPLAGCTTGVGSVTELPAGPTPRVVRLTITPTEGLHVLVGSSLPLTASGGLPPGGAALGAFAQFNNGDAHYVDATWTSSNAEVVAVANGALLARQRGSAVLTASFDGQTDTSDVVIDGGFFGRWAGTYTVVQCNANSGSMQDVVCRPPSTGRSGLAPAGAIIPFTIDIPETTSEDITARVTLGVTQGVLSGKNLGGGFFRLLGDLPIDGGTVSVVEWNMRGVNDAMEGSAQYRITMRGLQGTGAVVLRLTEVVRQ